MADKPLKYATVSEATLIHQQGKTFVYHNPCSKCKKECSTPTFDIWKKRIELFGGVKEMYEQYVCRDCKKQDKPSKLVVAAAAQPEKKKPVLVQSPPQGDEPSATREQSPSAAPGNDLHHVVIRPTTSRVPGQHVKPPAEGSIGFSVWEDGSFRGTTWYDLSNKRVD